MWMRWRQYLWRLRLGKTKFRDIWYSKRGFVNALQQFFNKEGGVFLWPKSHSGASGGTERFVAGGRAWQRAQLMCLRRTPSSSPFRTCTGVFVCGRGAGRTWQRGRSSPAPTSSCSVTLTAIGWLASKSGTNGLSRARRSDQNWSAASFLIKETPVAHDAYRGLLLAPRCGRVRG